MRSLRPLFSQVLIFTLVLVLPTTQVRAADDGMRSAVTQLQSDLAAHPTGADFDAASAAFFRSLRAVDPAARASAARSLKATLPYEAQDQVDALAEATAAGTLTDAQIHARLLAIAENSRVSGAAWDAAPTLLIGGTLILIVGIFVLSGISPHRKSTGPSPGTTPNQPVDPRNPTPAPTPDPDPIFPGPIVDPPYFPVDPYPIEPYPIDWQPPAEPGPVGPGLPVIDPPPVYDCGSGDWRQACTTW